MQNIKELVRPEEGLVSRQLFIDRELYEQELDRVFGRSWLFLAHDTQIPNAGDFLTTYMGEDSVLVTRRDDGGVGAFLNVCTHRGMLLCLAEEGRRKHFTCTYHGWTFDTDGRLVSVPREEACYRGGLDKSRWGLAKVPRIESYKGLHFGCLDPDAPPLTEFLGDFAWYLDAIFDTVPEGVEFVGGTQRLRLRCNWKLAAENIISDTYHVEVAHGQAVGICMQGKGGMDIGIEEGHDLEAETISASINGHGWNGNFDGQGMYTLFERPEVWLEYVNRMRPSYVERLGERRAWFIGSSIDGGLFPNFLFVPGFTFRIVHPKGPNECDLWMWTVVEKTLPVELKKEMVRFNARMLGTSGMFETDDCSNMENIGVGVGGRSARRLYSHYGQGLGRERPHPEFPGLVDQRISDNCFRGFYRRWAAYMSARSVRDVAADPPWMPGVERREAVNV